MTSTFIKDWIERVAWTAAQAVVGVVIVEVGDLDWAWAPAIVTGLAVVKGGIASRIGDPQTAATLPAPKPATPPAPTTEETP